MSEGVDWWTVLETGGILGVIATLWAGVRHVIAAWMQQPRDDNAAQDEEITRNRTSIGEMRRRMDRHDEQIDGITSRVRQVQRDQAQTSKELWTAVNERATHREVDAIKHSIEKMEDKIDKIYDLLVDARASQS